MRDPEDMLRSLPPESPPPEVVMAAIRVFRYRAVAAVALACALVLSTVLLKGHLDRDARLQERIGRIRYTTGGTIDINEIRTFDGLKVMLWEVVVDEADTSYVHVLAWDQRGRDISLDISDPEVDGRPTTLGAIESAGGGRRPTHVDLWQEIRVPSLRKVQSLTFDVDVEVDEVTGSIPFEIRL